MDIQKFQQKLTEVCELGEKNGKVLKPEQIKECFGELDLDKSQLIKILQYLKLKVFPLRVRRRFQQHLRPARKKYPKKKKKKFL